MVERRRAKRSSRPLRKHPRYSKENETHDLVSRLFTKDLKVLKKTEKKEECKD